MRPGEAIVQVAVLTTKSFRCTDRLRILPRTTISRSFIVEYALPDIGRSPSLNFTNGAKNPARRANQLRGGSSEIFGGRELAPDHFNGCERVVPL